MGTADDAEGRKMRLHRNDQLFLDFAPMDQEEIERLEVMDKVLKKADRELALVTADLTEGVKLDIGRPGMRADQVLRMALVKQMFRLSYEVLYKRVGDSIALRKFCGYEFELPPKPSTLQENIKKIRPETFEAVHRALVAYAKKEGIEDGKKVRLDTTPVETNIHHPTDSALLWDGVRVLTRMLKSARAVFPGANITFHDRTRVTKKLAFAIANAKGETERTPLYRDMIRYAEEVLGYAHEGMKKLRSLEGNDDEKEAASEVAKEIGVMAKLVKQVIDQTRRRVFQGEAVPASEKIASLFEPETEIIEKGQRDTIFGHVIALMVGKTSLVLDCLMDLPFSSDVEIYPEAIDRQCEIYGRAPKAVAADGGFASAENARHGLGRGVEDVSFSKRVGKALAFLLPSQAVHRMLMRFRAGIEGVISTLKRAVGLGRCLWKGWESFQSYVWASVVAHNLKTLTRLVVERRGRRAATG